MFRRIPLIRRQAWLGASLLFFCVQPLLADTLPPSASTQADTALPARRALLSNIPDAFRWGLHIDTDVVSTLHGGLQYANVSNNVIHASMAMDTGPLGWWSGGRFAVSAVRISSAQASVNDIGDLQGADNLDAPSASRIYRLSYRQRFTHGPFGAQATLRGGLLDLNQNFAATDAASTLLNASFGLNPTLSANIPIATYPKPGLGMEAAVQKHHWQLQLGLFQPNPSDRSDAFHRGALVIGEADYHHTYPDLGNAQFEFGLWHYRQSDSSFTNVPAHDKGTYFSVELSPSHAPDDMHMFLQLGHTPGRDNTVPDYLGAGISMQSPIPGRRQDLLTAGIAHVRIRNDGTIAARDFAGTETSYELSYLVSIHRHVTLQPDLQYIQHPSGRRDIQNALVAILRLHLEFY